MAGTRTLSPEPPRSTAYYYADLERLKRKSPEENTDQLSEYVVANEVVNEIPAREVPPLRDRQWSLPEYSTPENSRKGETYSTAGTFPMPEPKEKEPLLAELEVVGRLPLTQLESSIGVRRSRSWYLCCPNVGEEEMSRDSSWRYSSLRPVTVPPLPGQNGLSLVATQSSGRTDELSSVRAERDALARALAGERQRAAGAARAHDARLAELHGVIAELVRRRAHDRRARAIPEEELSDECESTTQPAGELDNDADRSRTEQNESSSILSPCELPTPQEKVDPLPDDTTDASSHEIQIRLEEPPAGALRGEHPDCDVSLNLSERGSHVCISTRCCEAALEGASSCEREHGSAEAPRVFTASPGRCESRQAKIASRVKLKRTEDSESTNHLPNEETWCSAAAERLALDVCAQADLREALLAANNDGERSLPVLPPYLAAAQQCEQTWCSAADLQEALLAANNDGEALSATLSACEVRCSRLQADCAVLQCALSRAADTAHRLYCACCVQESVCVSVCLALRAADRALETYDVLLALAETDHSKDTPEREAAELIASQLLARLDADPGAVSVGSPLLSPGPWLQHAHACSAARWGRAREAALRRHAARLKAETVALRADHEPALFSYHDIDEEDIPKSAGAFSMADMEAAVSIQEVLAAKEAIATAHANSLLTNKHTNIPTNTPNIQTNTTNIHKEDIQESIEFKAHKGESGRSRRRARERHWLETRASETDL